MLIGTDMNNLISSFCFLRFNSITSFFKGLKLALFENNKTFAICGYTKLTMCLRKYIKKEELRIVYLIYKVTGQY